MSWPVLVAAVTTVLPPTGPSCDGRPFSNKVQNVKLRVKWKDEAAHRLPWLHIDFHVRGLGLGTYAVQNTFMIILPGTVTVMSNSGLKAGSKTDDETERQLVRTLAHAIVFIVSICCL